MSTLASLRIRNYRCFIDHTVDFGRTTIVVGRNNAGKSTLNEALRLVSVALGRFKNPVQTAEPEWLEAFEPGPGQHLDLNRLGIWHQTIFHRYGDGPAVIDARFDDQSQLTLFVGSDGDGHAIFIAEDGTLIRKRGDLRGRSLPNIAILPQTVPLEREERILSADYVRQNLDTYLASRHFRNQLNLLWREHFQTFVELVESSWHTVRIDDLVGQGDEQGQPLRLMVRDGDFVAEIGWMGHGLQMWLQTVWFITRTSASNTLVLDEPDVYMHPDLQRKLVRFLTRQQRQLVIATHSTEILSEVDASAVLILDREQQRSSFATGLPAVQRVIENMGSAQNLQIARLWRARVLVLVEGEDMKVLKRIHDLVNPNSPSALDTVPNWSIGGWTGWANALGSATALQNSIHQNITCYCLFDSDYHLEEQKNERYTQARQAGIQLHILQRKEVENYLLIPSLVRRVIAASVAQHVAAPTEEEISEKIDALATALLNDAQDCFANEYFNANRQGGITAANRWAREYIREHSATPQHRAELVSGKKVLSGLSAWSKDNFDVSFGAQTLLRSLRRDEVAEELVVFVSAIGTGSALP